jgi:hypothetical protein
MAIGARLACLTCRASTGYNLVMRRRLLSILLVALVLAIVWAAAWFWLAGTLRAQVEAWADARRQEDVMVAYHRIAVAGFPFRWLVRLEQPLITGGGATSWQWQGDAVEAGLLPWSLRDVGLRFPGEQRFSAGDGNVAETWIARAARPNGRAVVDERGKLERVEFDFGDATLARAADAQPMRAERLTGQAVVRRGTSSSEAETFDLRLMLDNATLVEAPVRVLGTRIAHGEVDLAFKGRLVPGRLADAVAAWRDDGGTIEINRFAITWGPVNADGSGTLALDEQNRPLGAFAAKWRGYNEAIDALQAIGEIKPAQAAGVKIVLNAIARQNGQGVNEIQLPLTAQDGRLFVAGFPLLQLPRLKFD